MALLSQALMAGTVAGLSLASAAGDYFIDQPRITVADGVSAGGGYSIDGGLQSGGNQAMTNGGFQVFASITTLASNHAPAARPDAFSRAATDDLKIELQRLLQNDFDPDGESLSIQVPSLSAAGAAITVSNGWIYYLHGTSAPDYFEYTVTDIFGASSVGRVEILVGDPNDQFTMRLHIEVDLFGAHIRFAGIPTRAYVVQRANALEAGWSDVGVAMDLGLGRFGFDDSGAAEFNRFYRVVYRP